MTQATATRPPKPSPPRRVKQEPGVRPVWKNGRWVWRGELELSDGSFKTCINPDYAKAAEKLRALREQYSFIGKAPKETLYEEALSWLADQEADGRDVGTLVSYRYHIDCSIAPSSPGEAIGRKKAIAVTIYELNRLFVTLAQTGGRTGKGLGYHTLTHIKSTLVQVFHHIEVQGQLTRNVAKEADLPNHGLVRKPKPTRAPRKEQIDLIFATAASTDPLVEQFLQLGVGIGPRPGESLGAMWENVNWIEKTLLLNVTVKRKVGYTYTNGERVKEKLVHNSSMKNESSSRTVLLPDMAIAALARRQAAQEEEKAKTPHRWVDHGLIFTNSVGGPISFGDMGERVRAVTTAAGLGTWNITEVTRHAFATRVAMARDAQGRHVVKPEDLANHLGHKDGNPRTARKYYIDHGQLPVNSATAAIINDIFK